MLYMSNSVQKKNTFKKFLIVIFLVVTFLMLLWGKVFAHTTSAQESIVRSWDQHSPIVRFLETEIYYLSFIPEKYDVLIGVIGSGVNISLENLSEFIYENPNEIPSNGIDDDGNGYIDDVNGWNFELFEEFDSNDVSDTASGKGHETGVASLIVSKKIVDEANYHGICDIPQKIKVLPIRMRDAESDDHGGERPAEPRALNYALAMGVHVINVSFGSPPPSPNASETRQAYTQLYENGIPVVTSAGNRDNKGEAMYPSNYPGVITVGGMENDKTVWSNTSWGHNDFMSYSFYVPIQFKDGSLYEINSGTSYAAPIITGAIAKIMSYTGNYDRDHAYNLLQKHSVAISGSTKAGHGWVNFKTLAEEFVTFHEKVITHPYNENIKYKIFYSTDNANTDVYRSMLRSIEVNGVEYSIHEHLK
jgi:hypothetical protein